MILITLDYIVSIGWNVESNKERLKYFSKKYKSKKGKKEKKKESKVDNFLA